MRFGGAAALAAAAALSACTPYGLGGSVASFRQSVEESQKAYDEGLASYRREALSNQAARLTLARPRVQTTSGCGHSSAHDDQGALNRPCALMARGGAEPAAPAVLSNEPGARRQLSTLVRYVGGLEAVTNAADSKALSEATDQLAGAASALPLAAAAAGPQAAAAAAAAGVTIATAIKGGGTLARIALDYERLATLRRAVGQTEGPVRTVATGIGANLEDLRVARFEQVFGEANFRAERVGDGAASRYATDLQAAQDLMAAANALRGADGAEVGRRIAAAHDKLVKAANDPSAGAAEFAAAVGELADAVAALRAAMAATAAPAAKAADKGA